MSTNDFNRPSPAPEPTVSGWLTIRRALLLLLVMAVLWAFLWLVRMEPRRKAIARLSECGCTVADPQFISRVPESFFTKRINDLERSRLIASIRHWFAVESIDCRDPCPRTNLLADLAHFPELAVLGLSGDNINDELMRHIPLLDNLEVFGLTDTVDPNISDNGLKSLRGMPQLHLLELSVTDTISGEGLRYLTCEDTLEELNLWMAMGMTDAGLWEVRRFTNLRTLNLSIGDTDLEGDGFAVLKELPNLQLVILPEYYREHWEPYVSHIPNVHTE